MKALVLRACVIAAAVLIGSAARCDVAKIKIGYIKGTPITGLIVCVQKGFCKTAEFEVELVPFGGGGNNLQGVQSGDIQLGSSSAVPFLYYLTRAQDIIGIASESESGTVDFLSSGQQKEHAQLPQGFFIVRSDSPIKSVQDLKGTVIAGGNDKGTWPDIYMRKILLANRLSPDKDLTYTTLTFDLMPGALANKTIDGAFIWEPAYTQAKNAYPIRVLFSDLEVESLLNPPVDTDHPAGGGDLLFARRDWAEKNRPLLVAFLRQYKRSLDWMWSNYQQAKIIGATGQGFSAEVGAAWVDSSGPRDGKFSFDALRRAHNLMLEAGLLKSPIPDWPDRYIDYSYLDQGTDNK